MLQLKIEFNGIGMRKYGEGNMDISRHHVLMQSEKCELIDHWLERTFWVSLQWVSNRRKKRDDGIQYDWHRSGKKFRWYIWLRLTLDGYMIFQKSMICGYRRDICQCRVCYTYSMYVRMMIWNRSYIIHIIYQQFRSLSFAIFEISAKRREHIWYGSHVRTINATSILEKCGYSGL